MDKIRVGIVGLGANTRLRHVPGLLRCDEVTIPGVCNRYPESTSRVAREFEITNTYDSWQSLVADESIDAVVIGTWPYLHCPITVASLTAGKHVLTEARMAMNAVEARKMLGASRANPELTAQIVPSPLGLWGHATVRELIDNDLGKIHEIVVLGINDSLADGAQPFHWRQSAEFSGLNTLALGIIHETLMRWVSLPVSVFALTNIIHPSRTDASGASQTVTTPDIAHILARLECGAQVIYHLSGTARFGCGLQIHMYGSRGTLKYEFTPTERIWFGRDSDEALREITVSPEMAGRWRVEEEFINSIRGLEEVKFTDFLTGTRYMEFTQAVADSASENQPIRVAAVS